MSNRYHALTDLNNPEGCTVHFWSNTDHVSEMQFTGINWMDLRKGIAEWKNGKLIQDALPTLTTNQREFLLTGMTPEEWKRVFG